jgi:O-antigen/teichoic acid export membrane protein
VAFLLVAGLAGEIVSFDLFGLTDFSLIPQRYWIGLDVVPIILLANVCLAMYINLSVWFKITAQLRYGLFISTLGAVITILINAFTIPYLGYYGSALATLSCYGFMCIFCYYLGQKNYPIPYKFGRLMGYAVLVGFFYMMIRFLEYKGLSGMNITLFKLFLITLCGSMIFLIERKLPLYK